MPEREEVKHAVLEPEQTLRFRALELAILAERELRHFNIGTREDFTMQNVTREVIERADAFHAYIADGTTPEVSAVRQGYDRLTDAEREHGAGENIAKWKPEGTDA